MKGISLLIVIIIFGAGFYYWNNHTASVSHYTSPHISTSTSTTITFPHGGETFYTGETYDLTWSGGATNTFIFLIDKSLLSSGASVSIVDRVYGIKNVHTYRYTIPSTLSPGDYEFTIGDATSNTFSVATKK